MINELLKYELRMSAVGLTIKNNWHHKFKENSKGAEIFLGVKIKSTGEIASIEESTKESHITKRYYEFNKNNCGLTFKKSKSNTNKSIEKIRSGIQNTIDLSDMLSSEDDMKPLVELATRLKKIDPQDMWQRLIKDFPATEHEDCYISLDVTDIKESVQTESFMEKINKCLFKIDTEKPNIVDKTIFDSLGSPNPIDNSFNVKAGSYGNVNIFSCNPDNQCYERYGLNGFDRSSFSMESRFRLSRIFNEVIKNSHKFLFDKKTLIAISTLVPDDSEFFEGDFSPEEWKTYTENIAQKIINYKRGDTGPGEIIVFRKPSNGPWSIEYKKCLTLDELDDAVKSWDQGTQYFSTRKKPKGIVHQTPSIFCITKVLSSKYSKQKDGYRVNKVPIWTLNDSFELFSGSDSAFRKVSKIAAEFMLPVFVECVKINNDIKFPWEMRYAFAIFGMILNKEKIMLDELENHPMHCMGRLFHEADRMHRRFFTSRGGNPPPELIGQRYMRMCYDNPVLALGNFHKNFQKYLTWADNRHNSQRRENIDLDREYSVKTFREMVSKIGTNIPVRPTAVDLISLGCGFAFRKFAENTQPEGTNE